VDKRDILAELPNLTPQKRAEIRLKIAELDADGWDEARSGFILTGGGPVGYNPLRSAQRG